MPRVLPALVGVFALASLAQAAGPYDGLLKSVPPNANTLLLVNVKSAFASPLAKSDSWSSDQFKRYRSGIGFVPPDSELLVIASDVNLTSMTRIAQLGLVKMRNSPTMADISRREGGTLGDISGRLVVHSPRDVYYTTLPGAEFAAVYPADRQATARWIRYAKSAQTVDISPYLKQAAVEASDATMVIAVDLADVVEPGRLRLLLNVSPAVVKNKVPNIDVLTRLIATIKGMTFKVNVTDQITGTIRIDFGNDPTRFKNTVRDLFMQFVDDQGVAIPGLADWTTTFTATSMTLTGKLTQTDLRHLFSLFAFPGTTSTEDAGSDSDTPSAGPTRRYFLAVDAVLTDIANQRDSRDYNRTATWHDKAAEQIEHLSQRGVDPIALKAGFEASKRLRAIALSLRGIPINAEALSQQAYYHTSANVGAFVGWGGIRPYWNGNNVQTNFPQIRSKMAQIIANDGVKRAEAWSSITQIMGNARNTLQMKYKTRF